MESKKRRGGRPRRKPEQPEKDSTLVEDPKKEESTMVEAQPVPETQESAVPHTVPDPEVAEAQNSVLEAPAPTDFPSIHLRADGKPVCTYESADAREKGDRKYTVRVTNSKENRSEGFDSVGLNGLTHTFPLGVKTDMYGYQVAVLQSCLYTTPRVVEENGQLKLKGWEQRSTYSIDRDL